VLERDATRGAQTGRTRVERLRGPVFNARPGLEGRRILVLDDVVTTGATLGAAREALERQGAAQVLLYAVASTPAGSVRAERPTTRHLQLVDRGVAA
jgi:predicted amidophosphoribosyltransferase